MSGVNSKEKTHLLIVDDDPAIVSFLTGVIADRYLVTVAADGKHALQIVAEGAQIDIVVLDYRLPDISGLEILRQIKKSRPRVPVIFITAYGDEDVAVKAFRYGARDYLRKPFNYNDFLRVIEFTVSLPELNRMQPRKVLTAEAEYTESDAIKAINASTTDYNMQKAIMYINDNYMNRLSLEKIAEKACTSKYHFSRLFRQSSGCKLQEYIILFRMNKAKSLLKNTKLTVTEVAFSVGYRDLTNFERIFKKTIGCNPRQYRNMQGPDTEPPKYASSRS
jgi:YesN/AraC family two-component response regulator